MMGNNKPPGVHEYYQKNIEALWREYKQHEKDCVANMVEVRRAVNQMIGSARAIKWIVASLATSGFVIYAFEKFV